jgi:hypothetical protein
MMRVELGLPIAPCGIIQKKKTTVLQILPSANTLHLAPLVFKCLREFLKDPIHHGEGGELGDLNPLNKTLHFRLVQGMSLCPLRHLTRRIVP